MDRVSSTVHLHYQTPVGHTNKGADALSRRHALLTTLRTSVPGFAEFADLYPTDLFLGKYGLIYSLDCVQISIFMNVLSSVIIGFVFRLLVCSFNLMSNFITKVMLAMTARYNW